MSNRTPQVALAFLLTLSFLGCAGPRPAKPTNEEVDRVRAHAAEDSREIDLDKKAATE